MAEALTIHLRAIEDADLAEGWRDVRDLISHPGWALMQRAIDARVDDLVNTLADQTPSESAASYAGPLGEVRGLRSLPAVASGIISAGQRAEQALEQGGSS